MEENREKMEKTEKLTEEILYIQEEFDKIGVKLTNRQAAQFKMYADLLVEWNSFMNLTAITDFRRLCRSILLTVQLMCFFRMFHVKHLRNI